VPGLRGSAPFGSLPFYAFPDLSFFLKSSFSLHQILELLSFLSRSVIRRGSPRLLGLPLYQTFTRTFSDSLEKGSAPRVPLSNAPLSSHCLFGPLVPTGRSFCSTRSPDHRPTLVRRIHQLPVSPRRLYFSSRDLRSFTFRAVPKVFTFVPVFSFAPALDSSLIGLTGVYVNNR